MNMKIKDIIENLEMDNAKLKANNRMLMDENTRLRRIEVAYNSIKDTVVPEPVEPVQDDTLQIENDELKQKVNDLQAEITSLKEDIEKQKVEFEKANTRKIRRKKVTTPEVEEPTEEEVSESEE